jgi:replicative DNA helicase
MDNKLYKPLKYISIEEAVRNSIHYIDKRRTGEIKSLKTPWKKFNDSGLGGLEWQTITTIGGISGSGKTAIINSLESALFDLNPLEDFYVLSFNFEMLSRNLITRKFSTQLNLTTKQINSGEGALSDELMEKVKEEGKRLSTYKVLYVDIPGTIAELEATILEVYYKINKVSKPTPTGLVVSLDHSLLVKSDGGESEREMLMGIMEMFNKLKKRIKCITIVATQMNRDIEQPERLTNPNLHYPKRKDIFGGEGLFMYSDTVLVSMNPMALGLNSYGPNKLPVEDRLYWHFLKQRESMPFIAVMKNELAFNKVTDWPIDLNKRIDLNNI